MTSVIGTTTAAECLNHWREGAMQDPAAADKLTRVQAELDKTKTILHETIESVLDRGERLDDLVNKSNELSFASKQFYRQAKKTNSCWGCQIG
jgi:hypothetical protein